MADNISEDDARRIGDAVARSIVNAVTNPINEANKSIEEEAKKNRASLAALGKNALTASAQMTKAMTSASEGAGKYAGGVEQFGTATRAVTDKMGPLAKGIGFAVDMLAKLTGGVLRQNEAAVKSYRSLAKVGDLGRTFEEIKASVHAAGYSFDQQSEAYTSMFQKMAPNLALFSGTVTAGRKAFDTFARVGLGQAQYELERFGYNQEEIVESMGNMMGVLAVSGANRKKQDTELALITKDYLVHLSALTTITGQSRAEAERKMQKDANDLRYQMMLNRMEESGDEQQKLQARNIRIMIASMNEGLREGAKSMLVNGGAAMDEAGAEYVATLGYAGYDQMMETSKVAAEKLPEAFIDLMVSQGKTFKEAFDQFGPQIAVANDSMKGFMLNMDTWRLAVQASNMTEEKKQEVLKQIADMQSQLGHEEMDRNTKRGKQERKLRNAFEDFEYSLSKVVMPGLTAFTDVITELGSKLANVLYGIGGPDIRDAFRNFEDLGEATEYLKESQEKLIKLEKEEEKLKEEQVKDRERQKRYPGSKDEIEIDIKNREEKLREIAKEKSRLEKTRNRAYEGVGMSGPADSSKPNYELPKGYESREYAKNDLAQVLRLNGGITGNRHNFDRLNAGAKSALVDMATEYQALYKEPLVFNSGHRTFKEQMDVDPGGNPKAEPGTSLHEKGLAVDLNSSQVSALLSSGMLQRYGFKTIANDPPHIEYIGGKPGGKFGGVFKGPLSGYDVTLHGDEVVTPINKGGVTKLPLSSVSGNDSKELIRTFTNMGDKLDTLIDLFRSVNSTQDEMLRYAKQN